MTYEHFEKLITALEHAGCRITNRSANRARSQCPAHGGDGQNLSVFADADRVNGVCHSHECDFAEVLASVGLAIGDRYANPRGSAYEYRDAAGQLLRTVRRSPDKRFRQDIQDPRVTLFRLDRLATATGPVYLVEGEADVLAAESVGAVATTAPQGAGNFDKVDLSPLAGATVVAVVDRDEQGAKWAEQVRESLAHVATVQFRQAAHGKDLSDHLAAGHGLGDLAPYTFPPSGEPTPELLLVGAALRDVHIAQGSRILGGMFLDPELGAAFDALREAGCAATIPQLLVRLGRVGDRRFGALLADAESWAMVSDHEQYAARVLDGWERRTARGHIETAANLLRAGRPIEDVQSELMRVGRGMRDEDALADRVHTLGEYVDRDLPPEQWVIPDMLAARDRFILTGFEGGGKSTLLRQIAACVAVGCHPFDRSAMPPSQVLFVDCENPTYILQRKLKAITDVLRMGGYDTAAARMVIHEAPGGMDLTSPKGRADLRALCSMTGPDLLIIGPIYKMYIPSDARDEVHARQVAAVIDEIRADYGCAVMTEHHTPMDQGGQRPIRPVGTGLWLRWPEFGYGLRPEGDSGRVSLQPWRGSRDERAWPSHLQMAGTSPGRLPWSDANNLGLSWERLAIVKGAS